MLQEIVKFFINPVLQFSILILFLIKQKKPGKVIIAFIILFLFIKYSYNRYSFMLFGVWMILYDEEKYMIAQSFLLEVLIANGI